MLLLQIQKHVFHFLSEKKIHLGSTRPSSQEKPVGGWIEGFVQAGFELFVNLFLPVEKRCILRRCRKSGARRIAFSVAQQGSVLTNLDVTQGPGHYHSMNLSFTHLVSKPLSLQNCKTFRLNNRHQDKQPTHH